MDKRYLEQDAGTAWKSKAVKVALAKLNFEKGSASKMACCCKAKVHYDEPNRNGMIQAELSELR